MKDHINSFSKGMNSDALKSAPIQKELYNHALNGRVISELGSSSFAFENVKGNQFVTELPGVSNIFEVIADDASIGFCLNDATEFTIEITNSEGTYTTTILDSDPNWFPAIPPYAYDFYIWLAGVINDWATSIGLGVTAYADADHLLLYSTGGFDTINMVLSTDDLQFSYGPVGGVDYVQYQNFSLPIQAADLKIIGSAVTRDGWIIFSTDHMSTSPTTSSGQIWRLQINDADLVPTLTLLYNNLCNFSTKYPIQALTRYENAGRYNVYWTDNYNYLRVFNFADPNGFLLQPDQLNTFPSFDFEPAILEQVASGGAVEVGVYQLAYRLKRDNGTVSSVARPSNITTIYRLEDNANYYQIEGETYSAGLLNPTGKRITWTISNVDDSFTYLEPIVIKRVVYTANPIVLLLDPIPISKNPVKVEYSGLENAEEISLEEYLLNSINYFDTCKTLTSSNNMLLVGNVRSTKKLDVDYDARAYRFLYNSDTTYTPSLPNFADTRTWGIDLEEDVINPHTTEVSEWLDYHWKQDRYKYRINDTEIGGSGPNISYRFITQQTIEDTVGAGIDTNTGWVFGTGLNSVNTANLLSPPTDNVLNDYTYPTDSPISNMKSVYNNSLFRGYKRGETYRFGIVFYDLRGNPGYTKWIGDITFPRAYEDMGAAFDTRDTARLVEFPLMTELDPLRVATNQLGIEFTVNIPADVSKVITGYSIVRVKREPKDKRILSSGMIAGFSDFTAYPGSNPSNSFTLPWWDSADPNLYRLTSQNTNETQDGLLYFSPEFLFDNNSDVTPVPRINTVTDYLYSDGYYTRTHGPSELEVVGGSGGVKENLFMQTKLFTKNGSISTAAGVNVQPFSLSSVPSYYAQLNVISQIKRENNASFNADYYAWRSGQIAPFFRNLVARNSNGTVIGLGGKTTLIGLGTNYNVHYSAPNGFKFGITNANESAKWIADVCRFKSDQYGGLGYESRALNDYIGTGHYQRVEDSINSQVFTSTVFGGDTYVNAVAFTKVHPQPDGTYSTSLDNNNAFGLVYWFPTESVINTHLRHGNHYNKIGMSWAADPRPERAGVGERETYEYNSVFSCENDIFKYFPKPSEFSFIQEDEFDNRVYASEIKINGETTDSWSMFNQGNYIDLEGTYGPINNLVQYKNNVLAFQDRAFCVLNIAPKFFVQDTTGEEEAQLGKGKPLEGYNYISTDVGCRHQWAICKGSYAGAESVYFYDIEKNKMFKFTQGSALEPISDLKGMNAFLRANVRGTIINNDNPIEKTGITCAYDYRFNEAWFTFHTRSIIENLEGTPDAGEATNTPRAFTLSYSEPINAFNSFYSFTPTHYLGSTRHILSVNPDALNQVYMHHYGDYANFYGTQYPTAIKFTSNDQALLRKALYALGYIGEIIDWNGHNISQDTWNRIRVYTDYQNTDWITLVPGTNVARRERMWHLNGLRNQIFTADGDIFDPINMLSSLPSNDPRQLYPDRLRDFYFIVDLEYDNLPDGTGHNRKIILPYVKTVYNPSAR